MTTDRELLGLAAKAAGYEFGSVNDRMQAKIIRDIGTCGTYGCTRHQWRDWNPLTDDGDALRLAIKLGISIQFSGDRYSVNYEYAFDICRCYENFDHSIDIRRDIVRVAAEIGKRMP